MEGIAVLPEEYEYQCWQDIPPDVRALQRSLPLEQPQQVGEEQHFVQREEVILAPDFVGYF